MQGTTKDPHKGVSVWARAKLLLTDMKTRFPVMEEGKPLAVGSGLAIAKAMGHRPKWPPHSKALKAYADHVEYLKQIAAGGDRYDPITGEPSGKITEKQQELAKDRLIEKMLRDQARTLRKREAGQ